MLDYITEIDNDISRRTESKSTWGVNAPPSPNKSIPRKTVIVPENIFLSLKNDYYRENLFFYFRKLGAKSESQRDSDEEKRVKEEAYNFLKTSGGILVKYNDWNRPDLGYYEVDEEYARRSEYLFDDFNMRITSC